MSNINASAPRINLGDIKVELQAQAEQEPSTSVPPLQDFDLSISDHSETEFVGASSNIRDAQRVTVENLRSPVLSSSRPSSPNTPTPMKRVSQPSQVTTSAQEITERIGKICLEIQSNKEKKAVSAIPNSTATVLPAPDQIASPTEAELAAPTTATTTTNTTNATITTNTTTNEATDAGAKQKLRHRPDACVFVASLKSSMTDDELVRSVTEHFSEFGKVLSIKVLRDTRMSPYAFVQYDSKEDSEKAIRLCNGSMLAGRHIRCEKASVNRTVLIGPLPNAAGWDETRVKMIANRFGVIESVVAGAANMPYWFVRFAYRDDATRAYTALRMEGSCIVDWVQNLPDEVVYSINGGISMVSVGPLPQKVTESVLQNKFSEFGKIESIKLFPGEHNDACALIQYSSPTEAVYAIEGTCHTSFLGRTIRVRVLDVPKMLVPRFVIPPVQVPAKYSYSNQHSAPHGRHNGRGRSSNWGGEYGHRESGRWNTRGRGKHNPKSRN